MSDKKIVEHDGVEYEVPTWATVITRDSADRDVFYWEVAPQWTRLYGWYHAKVGVGSGRHGLVNPYVRAKPEGNFYAAI